MTVEERARACAAEMGAGDIWNRAIEAIEKHLRDQIEECAAIANRHAEEIGVGFIGYSTAKSIANEIARLAAESRCQYQFTEPEPPPSSDGPCTLGHNNPNLRQEAESPPLEARIAKACDKVLGDEDALAEMEAKR